MKVVSQCSSQIAFLLYIFVNIYISSEVGSIQAFYNDDVDFELLKEADSCGM